MSTDTRIPVPHYATVIEKIVDLALAFPDQTSRHAYVDSAGHTHSMDGALLEALGAPIHVAASGTYEFNGTKLRNTSRLHNIWNRLFLGETYDYPHVLFLGMPTSEQAAQDYLVYVLISRLQYGLDHRAGTWKGAAVYALKFTRRFLNNKQSGFLVQTRGAHSSLAEKANNTLTKAISQLS